MKIFEPSIPFNQVVVPNFADKALAMIKDLTDDQLRYALWCTLVFVFGNPFCNASELLAESDLPNNKEMAEAHQILAEIGLRESQPGVLKRISQERERLFGKVDPGHDSIGIPKGTSSNFPPSK